MRPEEHRLRLHDYQEWLGARGLVFMDYAELWAWSVDDLEAFWASVWDYFDVRAHEPYQQVLGSEAMPGATWFTASTLNYAEHALRRTSTEPAVIGLDELGMTTELSWDELRGQVGAAAAWLEGRGVGIGDHVVGYVPNVPGAVVLFLACASLGAVWSSCSPEYTPTGAADRFGPLAPRVLVVADGYRYGGRDRLRVQEAQQLADLLPSIETTLWISSLGATPDGVSTLADVVRVPAEPHFTPVPFDHPLWVLYSSGTTGRPKGIVHGHGGVLLEHLKFVGLHLDLGPGDRFFWFSTTSWMVWNVQVSGLLVGATIVLYDGSPTWPGPDALWRLAADQLVDFFGTSAAYLAASHKADVGPWLVVGGPLRSLGSTGSPLPPSTATWLLEQLPDVWLDAASGGTDIVSAFCGGVPTLPVRADRMQGRMLGVAMEAWDADGTPVVGAVGELVVTRPMPSMPLSFHGDTDGSAYRAAYFSTYQGVWRHGDWVSVHADGTVEVHGRSDATMNRHGVRMGSAEIYDAVESLPAVRESLVVGLELPDGGYWMPLFVVLEEGVPAPHLAVALQDVIRSGVSPRHVPDEVVVVSALPHTLTGKRLEVPVKRLLQGAEPETAVNLSAVDDPDALLWFVDFARSRRSSHAASR